MGLTWGMELRRLSVGDRGTLWKTFSLSLPLSPLGRLSMMASERKLLCRLLWLSSPILPCTSSIEFMTIIVRQVCPRTVSKPFYHPA